MLLRRSEVANAVDADEFTVTGIVSWHVVEVEIGSWLVLTVTEFETGVVLLVFTCQGVSLSQPVPDGHGPRVLLNVGNGGKVEVVPDAPPGTPVPRLADVKLTLPVPIGVKVVVDIVVDLKGEGEQFVPVWQAGVPPADGIDDEALLGLPDIPVAAIVLLEFVIGNGGKLGVGVMVPVPLAVPRPEDTGILPDGEGTVVEFDIGKGGDDVGAVPRPAEELRLELTIVPVPVAPMVVRLEFVMGNGGDVPVDNAIPEPTECPDGTPVPIVAEVETGPPDTNEGEVSVGTRDNMVLFVNGNGAELDSDEGSGDPEGVGAVVIAAPVESIVEGRAELESGKGTDDGNEELPDPVPGDSTVLDRLAVENAVFGDEEEGV